MKLIELSKQGKLKGLYSVKVDDELFVQLSKHRWQACRSNNTIYALGNVNGKRRAMHRIILGISDRNLDADHIDMDGLNNQKANLRVATRSQNATHKRKWKNVTSKFNGVHWSKERKKWVAAITFNYKAIALGRYNSEIDAAKAYDKKAKELFGEFANLNFT